MKKDGLVTPPLERSPLPSSSFQRGCSDLVCYVCMDVTVTCNDLNVPPLSDYQEFLHQTISDYRYQGYTLVEIANWFNENGYTTPRGHKFRSPHVHSIIKKRRLREERYNKPFRLEIKRCYVERFV